MKLFLKIFTFVAFINQYNQIPIPLKIGVTPFEPMASCPIGQEKILKQILLEKTSSSFKGYDIDLLVYKSK